MHRAIEIGLIIITVAVLTSAGTWAAIKNSKEATPSASAKAVTWEQAQALLKSGSEGKLEVDKVLPTTQMGYTVAISKAPNGQRLVTWISPDAKSFMYGALFDANGKNLSREVMEKEHIAPPQEMDGPRKVQGNVIEAVAQAEAVKVGTGGPTVFAFVDLNCHFCSGLYGQLAPLIAQGQLRVHWIPVSILSETSLTKAADVLQAPNPAQRLAEHEAGRDPQTGQGGLSGVAPTAATETAVKANTELLRVVNKGQLATPMLVFMGKNGEVFQHAGLLREASDILNAGG